MLSSNTDLPRQNSAMVEKRDGCRIGGHFAGLERPWAWVTGYFVTFNRARSTVAKSQPRQWTNALGVGPLNQLQDRMRKMRPSAPYLYMQEPKLFPNIVDVSLFGFAY